MIYRYINHYNSCSPSHPSRLPTSPEADVTEDSVDPEATDIASLPAGPAGRNGEKAGKTMGKPWENGKIMGKSWENHGICGKIIVKSFEIHEKTMEMRGKAWDKSWESHGKIVRELSINGKI